MSDAAPGAGPDAAPGSEVLFCESGASWRWLLGGPLAAGALVFVQNGLGAGFSPIVPLFFLVLLTAVFTIQVKAARIHTSVELTREALREGVETILLSEIVSVYPDPPKKIRRGETPDGWQAARTLGDLSGIPKGRRAIGLKLTNDRTAQAWARDDDRLRSLLTDLVEARTG